MNLQQIAIGNTLTLGADTYEVFAVYRAPNRPIVEADGNVVPDESVNYFLFLNEPGKINLHVLDVKQSEDYEITTATLRRAPMGYTRLSILSVDHRGEQ